MTKSIAVSLKIDPEDLAELFWRLDANDQARFFNAIGRINPAKASIQLAHIIDGNVLNSNGRRIMTDIGEFASE